MTAPSVKEGRSSERSRREVMNARGSVEQLRLFEWEGAGGGGAAILDDLVQFLTRYVAFTTRAQPTIVALWVVHTYRLDAAESTPRLAILSAEKRSGKTRLLELLSLLVRDPLHTSSCSAAALFHAIADRSPTVLIDEADAIFGKMRGAHEDLRAAINAGHRRGLSVYRVGNHGEVKPYPVFSPVAIAGIGDLPDTITDRAIVLRMRRRSAGESVVPFRRREAEAIGQKLRQRVERWADLNAAHLERAEPDIPDGISDRAADCVEPLLAIAESAGGPWLVSPRLPSVSASSPMESG